MLEYGREKYDEYENDVVRCIYNVENLHAEVAVYHEECYKKVTLIARRSERKAGLKLEMDSITLKRMI